MKIVFASDIHGSEKYCKALLEAFEREGADKLVLLGDILYHGPRNPLPEEYNPQAVVELLSAVTDKIICVRGNCDAEIDCALLPFPLPDYFGIFTDGLNIYVSHGHREAPPLKSGDVYITGHTHVQLNTDEDGFIHLNPGSVSLPKEDSARGYILYENRKFSFVTLDGEKYAERDLDAPLPEPEPEENPPVVRKMPAVRRKIIKRRRII